MKRRTRCAGAESNTVRRLERSKEVAALVALFERIAVAEGWQPEGALQTFTERSVYFGLYADGNLEPIGGLQIVLPIESALEALPCQSVWPELTPEPTVVSQIAHVAVLAVLPSVRRTGLYWHLCIALWRYCIDNGIRELWLEATPVMLRAYRLLGLPLVVQGPLRVHWGEPCYPCKLSVREVAGALAERAVRSSTYRHLFTRALEPILTQAA